MSQVRIDDALRARQPAAVDDAGVVELVAEYRVASARPAPQWCCVGGETRRKHQRGLSAFEFGQSLLEPRCRALRPITSGLAPLPQPSSSAASAAASTKPRVGGQPQIVVRAEVEQAAAVEYDRRPLQSVPRSERSPQCSHRAPPAPHPTKPTIANPPVRSWLVLPFTGLLRQRLGRLFVRPSGSDFEHGFEFRFGHRLHR